MGKWVRVDQALVEDGADVKVVRVRRAYTIIYKGQFQCDQPGCTVGGIELLDLGGKWYVRRPKPAKTLTRPDEPPVGTFFRVDRTGNECYRRGDDDPRYKFNYVAVRGGYWDWDQITKPGDTITRLDLVERES